MIIDVFTVLVYSVSEPLLHGQLRHIWFTYEYHMRIICFVSYENHKKGHHIRMICGKSYDTYDIHMWIICKQLHMNKGASYVNHMNHIKYFHMKIIWKGHHMVIIWIIFAYCIYALLFFEKQVTRITVNFKTFN